MKTSVVMIRKMGQFDVFQRTKDGMFNATELIKQWNENSKTKKDIKDFFSNQGTTDFLNVLIDEENLNGGNYPYLATRGKNGGTWMHPILYIKFCMWLSPKFEYHVIKFVYDDLIKQRNDAGDGYVKLSSSGIKLKGYDFSKVATAMQWIVYGTKGKELRQSATQEQLSELNDIQTKLSFAIDMGYIKTYNQLIIELRKIYRHKYLKSPF